MMSRTLFLALCMVVTASADLFRAHCTNNDACGGEVCCGAGWQMTETNTCVNIADGTECGLCRQTGMAACAFTAENSLHPVLRDATGVEVAVAPSAQVMGASGHILPPTTPSSGVSIVLGTYNGMAGWGDIPPSAFFNFQEFLLGLTATVPSFYTAAGYSVSYSCNRKGFAGVIPAGFKGCDIFFFVYRCPPCEARNGNIGQKLLEMDEPTWYAGNCGPTFRLNKAMGVDHQFAVYMAEIAEGTDTTIVLDYHVEFMFWAMVGKSVICSEKLTKADCNGSPINCQWLEGAGVCRPRGCDVPVGPPGPPTNRCSVCVDDEHAFIPQVILP